MCLCFLQKCSHLICLVTINRITIKICYISKIKEGTKISSREFNCSISALKTYVEKSRHLL